MIQHVSQSIVSFGEFSWEAVRLLLAGTTEHEAGAITDSNSVHITIKTANSGSSDSFQGNRCVLELNIPEMNTHFLDAFIPTTYILLCLTKKLSELN